MDKEKLDLIWPNRTPEHMVRKLFGLTLKHLMIEAKITETELAKSLGISRQSVCMYKNGETSPRMDIVFRIAEALNIDSARLFKHSETIEALMSSLNAESKALELEKENYMPKIRRLDESIGKIKEGIETLEDLKKYCKL
jgi:transcriptional regulator with XRE-family HTH domain